MMSRLSTIDASLLEAIDEVLENVFGENGRNIIVQTLRKKNFMKWNEVPKRPKVLADTLKAMFESSSIIVEDLILENFYSKLNLNYKWKKSYRFSDYINEVKYERINEQFERKRLQEAEESLRNLKNTRKRSKH